MIWRRSPLLTVKSTDKSALSSRITRHCIRFLFGKIRWDLIWLAALFDWGPLVASVLALRPFRRLRNRSILSYSFHLQAKWQNFRRFFFVVVGRHVAFCFGEQVLLRYINITICTAQRIRKTNFLPSLCVLFFKIRYTQKVLIFLCRRFSIHHQLTAKHEIHWATQKLYKSMVGA